MAEEGIKIQDIAKATEVKATDLLLSTTSPESGTPENKNVSIELLKEYILSEATAKATLENGVTGDITLKKIGKIVIAQGRIETTITKAGTKIATIPDNFRAYRHLRFLIPRYDTRFGTFSTGSEGDLVLVHDTNISEETKSYYISSCWTLE